jgi:hypothetical protein
MTRRKWTAVIGLTLLYSVGDGFAWTGELPVVIHLILGLAVSGLMIMALIRFGIVGLLAHQLVFVMLANRPFIFNPQSIYFEVSVAGALVMSLIIAYGFFVSLGGARFDLGRLLEGSPQR